MKIFEWNINQRVNSTGKNIFPPWLIEEIINQDADVFVLTEFFKIPGWDVFLDQFTEYQVKLTDNSENSENDVVIAVKKKYPIIFEYRIECGKDNNNPGYLRVDVEMNNKVLSIIGARLRSGDSTFKIEQNKILFELVRVIENPILIIGDFNNNRRGTIDIAWNMNVIEKMYSDICLYMQPILGGSIYAETERVEYQFAEDHIIVSSDIEVSSQKYDRDFVERDKAVYVWGRDFQKYIGKNHNGKNIYDRIPVSWPDHAILSAKIFTRNTAANIK